MRDSPAIFPIVIAAGLPQKSSVRTSYVRNFHPPDSRRPVRGKRNKSGPTVLSRRRDRKRTIASGRRSKYTLSFCGKIKAEGIKAGHGFTYSPGIRPADEKGKEQNNDYSPRPPGEKSGWKGRFLHLPEVVFRRLTISQATANIKIKKE